MEEIEKLTSTLKFVPFTHRPRSGGWGGGGLGCFGGGEVGVWGVVGGGGVLWGGGGWVVGGGWL